MRELPLASRHGDQERQTQFPTGFDILVLPQIPSLVGCIQGRFTVPPHGSATPERYTYWNLYKQSRNVR